jgi:hypothetical protein
MRVLGALAGVGILVCYLALNGRDAETRAASPRPLPDVPQLRVASEKPGSTPTPLPDAAPLVAPPIVRSPETEATISVKDAGATGDGRTDDTEAIQRANDLVAMRGGGDVFFPPGTYVAAGVIQDSFVTFVGSKNAVLKHPDGVGGSPIISSRIRSTRGSISAGSRSLRVAKPDGFVPGGLVAIRAAGGGSPSQRGRLAVPLSSWGENLVMKDASGLANGSTFSPNYVMVGEEVVSYARVVGDTLIGLRRGMFGSAAANHPAGTAVSQALVHYARIRTIGQNEVLLDRPARFTVTSATVLIGSIEPKIERLTLDGNRRPDGSTATNPMPVQYSLAYGAVVRGCTIYDGDHGGIAFDKGTRGSVIENNTVVDSGTPTKRLGAGIWLFRGASANAIVGNDIGGSSVNGMYLDDRTTQSTEYDADVRENVVVENEIKIDASGSNIGIAILGSSDNYVARNRIFGTTFGIRVFTGGDSVVAPETARNRVEGNHVEGHSYGIWVDGRSNEFVSNRLFSNEVAFVDIGEGNRSR